MRHRIFCFFSIAFTISYIAAATVEAASDTSTDRALPRATPPGVADRDGNRLSDGLEARLAALGRDEAVDVIVTFMTPDTPAAAARAVGPFAIHAEFSIVPGFAARMTAGQARSLARVQNVRRVEEDAAIHATDVNTNRDFGVERIQVAPSLGGLGLTGAGIGICVVDTGIFAEHEQFRHSLDDDSLDSGECRLASPGSVGLMLYPFILGQQQMQPGLTVSYSFAFNAEIVADVLGGRHDLGIVTEAVRHPELECEAWHQEPLCLVVPADFAGHGLGDLMGIGFISYSGGEDHAGALLRANFPDFRSMSHFPRQGFTNEVSMVLDAVARGLGFTVVSRVVLELSLIHI